MIRIRSLVVFSMALAAIGGCAVRPPPMATIDRDSLQIEPTIQPVHWTDLWPARPQYGTYRRFVSSGLDEERRFKIHREGDRWTVDIVGVRVTHLRLAESGDLVINREVDLDQNVQVHYDPGLLTLPRVLQSSTRRQSEVKMVVRPVAGGNPIDQGTCLSTIKSLGRAVIQTPLGSVDAVLVREQRRIRLRLAQATVTIDTAYALDRGRIVNWIERSTRQLGLFSTRSWEQLVRVQ